MSDTEQIIENAQGQVVNNDKLVIFNNSINTLREMVNIQCSSGNWNYDPYMHGMANGMILALSMFNEGFPEYLDAPEVWLCDLQDTNKPIACSECSEQENL